MSTEQEPRTYRVVTVDHLRDAIEAGVAPVKHELGLLRRDVEAIVQKLETQRQWRRWLMGRATKILDGWLPLVGVAVATYLLTHFLT